MKRFFISVLLLAAVIVGIGIYRGWFAVNNANVEKDEAAISRSVHNVEQQVKNKTSGLMPANQKQK